MRDLGTTSTTSLVRTASVPATDAATTAPPTTTSSTTTSSTNTAPPTASSSTTSAPPVEVATVVRFASGVTLLDTFREAADGEVWWQLPDPGPVDGPRVLLATDLGGPEWVEVLLRVRPNETRGWVRRSDVILSTVDTRIVLNLAERRLTAYRGHEVLLNATVVVGPRRRRHPRDGSTSTRSSSRPTRARSGAPGCWASPPSPRCWGTSTEASPRSPSTAPTSRSSWARRSHWAASASRTRWSSSWPGSRSTRRSRSEPDRGRRAQLTEGSSGYSATRPIRPSWRASTRPQRASGSAERASSGSGSRTNQDPVVNSPSS